MFFKIKKKTASLGSPGAGAPSPAHIPAETLRKPEEFFDLWIRGVRCPLKDVMNHVLVHKLKLINA